MHKNPSMGIREPMLEINKFLRLTDPGRTLRFIQDSKEMFRKVEVSGTALVHSQIISMAGPNKVSVIICSLRQKLGIN
jgi:hypothetical protein